MTESVSEYMNEFSRLVEQLIAYGRHTDPVFFAMRFVDGMPDDIRQAVHCIVPQHSILLALSPCCRRK